MPRRVAPYTWLELERILGHQCAEFRTWLHRKYGALTEVLPMHVSDFLRTVPWAPRRGSG